MLVFEWHISCLIPFLWFSVVNMFLYSELSNIEIFVLFQVLVTNVQCRDHPISACTKAVFIVYKEHRIHIQRKEGGTSHEVWLLIIRCCCWTFDSSKIQEISSVAVMAFENHGGCLVIILCTPACWQTWLLQVSVHGVCKTAAPLSKSGDTLHQAGVNHMVLCVNFLEHLNHGFGGGVGDWFRSPPLAAESKVWQSEKQNEYCKWKTLFFIQKLNQSILEKNKRKFNKYYNYNFFTVHDFWEGQSFLLLIQSAKSLATPPIRQTCCKLLFNLVYSVHCLLKHCL
jgi:hypothetical protein